jgi:hypothetical protein
MQPCHLATELSLSDWLEGQALSMHRLLQAYYTVPISEIDDRPQSRPIEV